MSDRSNDGKIGHLPLNSMVPIRTIASLTGVNPVTLRAWERRYNLLCPTRTAKGHRLYSMADVELIKQVLTLLEGGMSISQVQCVLNRNDREAATPAHSNALNVRGDTLAPPSVTPDNTPAVHYDFWQSYQQRLLQAIHTFDNTALHDIYNEILALYPIDIVTTHLIVPLLHELGWRWQRGNQTGIAEEHFFSVFIRNKLGARLHHCNRHQNGPCLVAACLPDEQHDMGLLLFTLIALDWNYRIILLGAATPLAEIPLVSRRIACDGIVLAGCYQLTNEILNKQMPQLINAVESPVFIGGRVLSHHTEALQTRGLIPLSNDFQQALRIINSTLKHPFEQHAKVK